MRRVKRHQRRTLRKQKKAVVKAGPVSEEHNALKHLFTERHEQSQDELVKRCRVEFDRSKIRFIVPESDCDKVFAVLCDNFHEIEEIYMFFSTLDNGPINTMSSSEFNEFVRHCGVIDSKEEPHEGKEADDAMTAAVEAAEAAAASAIEQKKAAAAEKSEKSKKKEDAADAVDAADAAPAAPAAAAAKTQENFETKAETNTTTNITTNTTTTVTTSSPPRSLSGKKKKQSISTRTQPPLTMSTLATIFVACNIEKENTGRIVHDPKNSTRELLRFEFLESLVRLALAKYKTSPPSMLRATASEKVDLLMTNFVQDYACEISDRSAYLRQKLSQPSILEIYASNMQIIERVFKKYCTRDSVGFDKGSEQLAEDLNMRRGSMQRQTAKISMKKSGAFDAEEDRTISFSEFLAMMTESHVVDGCVNVRVLKTLYMQSMQFSYSMKQSEDEVYRTSTQQVFIEFLESLARVAVAKFGDDGADGSMERSLRKIIREHLVHMDPKRLLKGKQQARRGRK